MNTKSIIIIASILSFIIGFFLGKNIFSLYPFGSSVMKQIENSYEKQGSNDENLSIRRDTVYKEVPAKPIYIKNAIAKVIYKYDTIQYFKNDTLTYNSLFTPQKSWTAKLDTILNKDTINLQFEYPNNTFCLDVRKKSDSIIIQRIEILKYKEKDRPWWEMPAYITGGAFLGYIFGRIK